MNTDAYRIYPQSETPHSRPPASMNSQYACRFRFTILLLIIHDWLMHCRIDDLMDWKSNQLFSFKFFFFVFFDVVAQWTVHESVRNVQMAMNTEQFNRSIASYDSWIVNAFQNSNRMKIKCSIKLYCKLMDRQQTRNHSSETIYTSSNNNWLTYWDVSIPIYIYYTLQFL